MYTPENTELHLAGSKITSIREYDEPDIIKGVKRCWFEFNCDGTITLTCNNFSHVTIKPANMIIVDQLLALENSVTSPFSIIANQE